jgi:HEAT repeat protein
MKSRLTSCAYLLGTLLFLPAGEVLAQHPSHVPATTETTQSDFEVIAETMHLTRKRTAPPVAELVTRIEPHVRLELPRVLRMLYDGKAPPLADEESLPLSSVQEALLEGALEGIPRTVVIAAMEDVLRGKEGDSVRRLRIQIEGCVGSAGELPALFDLALHEKETSIAPRLEEKLRAALSKIAARDPERADAWLLRHWEQLRKPLLEPVVMALGDADDPHGVAVLTSIATWNDELAFLAIAQVRSLGPSTDEDVNYALLEVVRRRLDLTRPDRSQALVLVMGELSDFESIPLLLDLLEDSGEGMSKSALWALQRMTGLRLPAKAESWRRWLDQELAWKENERADVLQRLDSPERADVVAAVQELARHRYERPFLAERLAETLENPDPMVRVAACEGLAALASPAPKEALLRARKDHDSRVAAAAEHALGSIFGSAAVGKTTKRADRKAAGVEQSIK